MILSFQPVQPTLTNEVSEAVNNIQNALNLIAKTTSSKNSRLVNECINLVYTQTERMSHLAYNLHELAEINCGSLKFNMQCINVKELIAECIHLLPKDNMMHNIEVVCSNTANVYSDKQKLIHVLHNLISNAFKYSQANSTVIIEVSEHNRKTEIVVRDFGIGISQEHLPYIFQSYYKTEDNDSNDPGMGLGLFICNAILREQYGKIWVESREESGSAFHVLLPAFKETA